MYSRILVPLDGSKMAERALPHAVHFARIFESSLILLRVLDPSKEGEIQDTPDPFHWQVRKAEADVYLKGVASVIRELGIETETTLLEGKTPENIIDYAQSQKIDLVTITTHGAGGLSRWNTSSVFRKVVEKIYLPILVVRAYRSKESEQAASAEGARLEELEAARSGGEPGDNNVLNIVRPGAGTVEIAGMEEPGRAALSQKIAYKKILLPIDSSRRAECSLPAATALTEATGAQLILASIVRPPDLPLPQPYSPEVNQMIEKFVAVCRESANAYLQELEKRIQIPVKTRLIEHDSVVHAIHNLAEQEEADLVIFCAHGQTGRIDLPYGSVSRNYIEHGTRNALVIQDVPRSQVRPTEAEIAAEKYGRR